MVDVDKVAVTIELIAAGRSNRGGWSAGWKDAAIGRLIPLADAERFVVLRSGGQSAKQGDLFGPG